MSSTQALSGGARRQLSEGFSDRYAWIANGCARLMKCGGGSLVQEMRERRPAPSASEVARLYAAGMTQGEIADALNVSATRVYRVMRDNGIAARDHKARRILANRKAAA